MSEKMDGIRAYWDGSQLLSRQGNIIQCPQWFTSRLPTDQTLDGELWMGPGTTVQDVMKVLYSKRSDWSGIGYYLFDCPSSSGTYEERMSILELLKSVFPTHINIVKSTQCTGIPHLYEYLASIIRNKGEGVMIREPLSAYETGLTSSLLKVKVIQGNQELIFKATRRH